MAVVEKATCVGLETLVTSCCCWLEVEGCRLSWRSWKELPLWKALTTSICKESERVTGEDRAQKPQQEERRERKGERERAREAEWERRARKGRENKWPRVEETRERWEKRHQNIIEMYISPPPTQRDIAVERERGWKALIWRFLAEPDLTLYISSLKKSSHIQIPFTPGPWRYLYLYLRCIMWSSQYHTKGAFLHWPSHYHVQLSLLESQK